jgi:hypothetical protein
VAGIPETFGGTLESQIMRHIPYQAQFLDASSTQHCRSGMAVCAFGKSSRIRAIHIWHAGFQEAQPVS